MDGWDRIIADLDDLRRRQDAISADTDGLRRRIMQLLDQAIDKRGAPSKPGRGPGLKEYSSLIGRNIDMLRLECGWSYGDLSIVTGLKKHTILAHVNKGIRPRPGTMKLYADTFSEKLGRQISVFDLQK